MELPLYVERKNKEQTYKKKIVKEKPVLNK